MIRSRDDDAADARANTAVPFIAALAIIVLVIIGIGAIAWSNRGDDAEREAVVRAALAHNDALQRLDYGAFRANTCAAQAGAEADVLARQQKSVAAKGARYVDNVTGVTVDGDKATAAVQYHFANDEGAKIDTATTFVREDGSWRVCTPGPG